MKRAKLFEISKKVVREAWKRVKANHGAAGVDEESITDFEKGQFPNNNFLSPKCRIG